MDKGRDTFVKICFIVDIKEFTTYYYSEKYVTFALKFTAFKMMKNHIKLISSLILLFISALIITGCANKKEEGQALFENGLKNMKNGNLPIAYRQIRQAVMVFEEENDSIGMFEAKTHLSLLCSVIGQKKEGYELIKSTPYFHVKRKGIYSSQYYWRMKAYYAFTLENDYQTASVCINNLLKLDSIDFPEKKTYLYMDKANQAEMYLMTKQTDRAWEVIRELENSPLKDDQYLSQTYYIHALLLMQEGKADSACAYARRSIEYSSRYNAPENEANAMKIIMKNDSAKGDIASYIRQRNSYDSLTNHIRGNEITHHIAVIQEQHKFDLTLKEIQRKHMERNLWFGGFTIGIGALCVIIFLIYKQNKLKLKSETAERMRLDQEIEYKKLENELLTLKMQQTKEELQKQHDDNADAIRQLASSDDRKNTNTRLKMLEATLNTNHNAFIQYINRNFPQLTHNDILILGFMRMDMKPQEIASVLGISVDSLHKAKYRLRKKLSVDSMAALTEFTKNWNDND